ncbi:HEPN domain-containing protein [Candidatus Woesearchaeota archaeon]|nr:HEPN domain-containing protein [Candidatus Woesearchaeota archaeon]
MELEVKRWWEQARQDLGTAHYLFEGKKFKEASFFCQQAAEKSLKAVLIKKEKKIIKIHDLVKLAQLVHLDPLLLPDCKQLTFVYIDARYPDTGQAHYSQEESNNDLERAARILKWAEKNI